MHLGGKSRSDDRVTLVVLEHSVYGADVRSVEALEESDGACFLGLSPEACFLGLGLCPEAQRGAYSHHDGQENE